ncbi:FadR family transcriptional regulator [Shewanella sp. A3A]|nr:FadR family transcriptional regulator [Shewanella ferrihydritica]
MARLENLNLSQRVTNELGKAIVAGKYNMETGLPTEAQLCDMYGISRTAIREAVKMLAAKGLISSRPRQGIRVEAAASWNLYDTNVLNWMLQSGPSLQVLKEFLQVRLAIEPQAAALAAQYGKDEDIAKIAESLESMRKAARTPNQTLHESDLAFHTSVLLASGNRFFFHLRDFINTALGVSIQHTTPAKGSDSSVAEEHAAVYDAILARQPELARSLMSRLIEEAMQVIDRELQAKLEA